MWHEREHLPRKRRTLSAPPFQLMERDIAVIKAVHHYRLLERRHVEDLFFVTTSGQRTNTNRARERLRLLYQHGYLERIHRPIHPSQGSQAPVYRLGASGAKFLSDQQVVPLSQFRYWGRGDDKDARQTQVSQMFLEHSLALVNVRLAVEQSTKRNNCSVEKWIGEAELRQLNYWDEVLIQASLGTPAERIPIAPDSYFVLATPHGRGCFFVEVDRSTETVQKTWRRKILSYKEYIRSGKFHQRYGVPWPHTPLRILTTTLSNSRAENLKTAVERYGSAELSRLFLFTPMNQIQANDILTSPIWLRAGSAEQHKLL